jgi:hypothetical protein
MEIMENGKWKMENEYLVGWIKRSVSTFISKVVG